MKKLTLIATSLVAAGVLYTGANSANAQSKLSFGLNVGAGIPMGAYAKHDSSAAPVSYGTGKNAGSVNDTTKLNGFAKTGFHFNVYGQYMIAGPIGVKLMIGGSMNSYDVATLNSDYQSLYTKYYGAGASAFAPSYTATNYYVGQYLVGPCLKLPAGKINIEGQILVGLVTSGYPTLTENISNAGSGPGYTYTETGTDVVTFKSASGFGYNINAGIEYMITDMIGLHFNVGYTGSSLSFASRTETQTGTYTETITGFGTTTTPINSAATYNDAKTMSLGLLQITVGGSIDL